MKIECDIEFASYIYASFLYMQKRLQIEEYAAIETGDKDKAKTINKVRGQIEWLSVQTADEIRDARSSGRSVSLELQPTLPSPTIQKSVPSSS